jgi:hypothetical protein
LFFAEHHGDLRARKRRSRMSRAHPEPDAPETSHAHFMRAEHDVILPSIA